MYKWIQRLHMYSGLLSFTAFVVYGFAGLHATVQPPPSDYEPPPLAATREIPFEAPGDLDDRALANRIYETIELSYARPPQLVRRDDDNNLWIRFHSVHGFQDVRYLENERKIRVERHRNDDLRYLNNMHVVTSRRASSDLPLKLWGFYNEFSLWALLFMTVSGAYLWIASRPRMRWAQITAAAGVLFFLILFAVTR